MSREYIFANKKTDVTHSDLNTYFGDRGMTFKERKDAANHKRKLARKGIKSYVTRLRNYNINQVVSGFDGGLGVAHPDAKDYTIGYLVTVLGNK